MKLMYINGEFTKGSAKDKIKVTLASKSSTNSARPNMCTGIFRWKISPAGVRTVKINSYGEEGLPPIRSANACRDDNERNTTTYITGH